MKRLLLVLLMLPLAVSAREGGVVFGYHGSYGYYGELWYPLHIDRTMGLGRVAVKGVDYDADVSIDPGSFPNNSTISWRVPDEPPQKKGVYGYPHLSWGAFARKAEESSVTPSRVRDIDTLSVTFSLSQRGTPDGASVLNEFFLVSDPNDPDSRIVEIGLFATSTASSSTLMDTSRQLGRLRDAAGRLWLAATTGGPVPFIMFRPADGADVTGTVDWKFMLDFLREQGLVSGREWFTGMAIGPEPRVGDGAVTVSVFEVSYRRRG